MSTAAPSLPDLPCCLNGEFTTLPHAKISVMDRGFIFGDGIYEVIPVYGGRLFRFDEHMARLERSLRELRIEPPHTRAQWREATGLRIFWPPAAVIARLGPPGPLLFTHCIQLLRRAVTVISGAGFEHCSDDLSVTVHTPHLIKRALIGSKSKPLHAVQDGLDSLWRGALYIRIFNTKNELAAVAAGISPAIQRSAGAAHVEVARWARRKPGSDGLKNRR